MDSALWICSDGFAFGVGAGCSPLACWSAGGLGSLGRGRWLLRLAGSRLAEELQQVTERTQRLFPFLHRIGDRLRFRFTDYPIGLGLLFASASTGSTVLLTLSSANASTTSALGVTPSPVSHDRNHDPIRHELDRHGLVPREADRRSTPAAGAAVPAPLRAAPVRAGPRSRPPPPRRGPP